MNNRRLPGRKPLVTPPGVQIIGRVIGDITSVRRAGERWKITDYRGIVRSIAANSPALEKMADLAGIIERSRTEENLSRNFILTLTSRGTVWEIERGYGA